MYSKNSIKFLLKGRLAKFIGYGIVGVSYDRGRIG